ncbi:MAG TPA: SRPBCC family protein [Candidatus Acidoferrales bacterium]|nr:SRPBCC family protein [Candidatus Acidoferrales bacterium]
MKILLVVLGAIALLILVVVITGVLLPKHHHVSRAASFRATPQQLFALVSGPQNWRPDVKHFETVPDASGRDFVRETTSNGETVTYELLDRQPPQSIKRKIATEGLPYSGAWTFQLQEENNGTTVRIIEDGDVYNPIFRFVSRFVIGHTRTIDDYLRALGKATGQEQIQIRD